VHAYATHLIRLDELVRPIVASLRRAHLRLEVPALVTKRHDRRYFVLRRPPALVSQRAPVHMVPEVAAPRNAALGVSVCEVDLRERSTSLLNRCYNVIINGVATSIITSHRKGLLARPAQAHVDA
jgi:hypothetical protein